MRRYYPIIISFLFLFGSCEEAEITPPIPVMDDFSSELFFSEYIEGTSYNKALVIKNITGETIILEEAGYSIRKQPNGKGDWTGELKLTGVLAPYSLFVIANASADATNILSLANQVKSGAPMDFNGNDPVGLFRDGILIDIIGEKDNSSDFGKDIILRRNPEISEPSVEYKPGEWERIELDQIGNLADF